MSTAHSLRNTIGGTQQPLITEERFEADGSAELITSVNPSTGERVAGGVAPIEAVNDAVEAARGALAGWRRLGVEGRISALRKVADRVDAHRERIAGAISLEMGKPRAEALVEAGSVKGKIEGVIAQLSHTLPSAPPNAPGEQRFHPLGVIGVIGPFNFPVHLLNTHVIPALLTGNTIILKPSEVTPLSAQRYMDLFLDAGFPEGVINLVHGAGKVGGALSSHEGLNGVIFTGSYETGRRIREATFDQPHKKVCLELGGKNPALVLDDADLAQATREILLGALLTTGQRCTATSRVIVTKGIAEPLKRALTEALKKIEPSDPMAEGCFIGPLANLSAKRRFLSLLAQGKAEGARPVVESQDLSQAFVTPSMYEVSGAEPYLEEELFGPHIAFQVVEDEAEAFAWASKNPYGLSASVFSAREEALEALYDLVPAGVLNWNRSTNGASGLLPFGGVGKSGNWHPAGSEGPRLSTYAVAVMSVPFGELTPHAGLDRQLARDPLKRLERQHRAEEVCERFGCWLSIEADVAHLSWDQLKVRGGRGYLSGRELQAYAQRAGLTSNESGLMISLESSERAEHIEEALLRFFDDLMRLDPERFLARPRRELLNPSQGELPRSKRFLDRFYGGDFLPKEKKPLVADLARSQGPFLRSVDERPLQIIDAASQIASLPGGFRPDVVQRDLDDGLFAELVSANAHADELIGEAHYEALATQLLSHAPKTVSHVCWTNGGAEANEKAFHLAKMYGTGGKRVLAFEGAFHGRTLISLYCTWNEVKRAPYQLAGHEAVFLKRPIADDPYFDPEVTVDWLSGWRTPASSDASPEEVTAHRASLKGSGDALLATEVDCLVAVELAIRQGDVLTCIIEPYQCEGGDVSPTRRFFNGLRALTRAYGVPLIFDEVQSGFGLSGPVFWHERFDLRDAEGNPEGPDFVTGAKRAQVGYVLSPYPDPDPGPAHAVSARRGVSHLEIITTQPSHEALARAELDELIERWPQVVTRPRVFGDAFGFDLPSTEVAMHLINQRFYQGYMVYIAGKKTLRYRLNRGFKPSEVSEVFAVIDRSIEALVEQAGGVEVAGGEPLLERMSACVAPAWVDRAEDEEDHLPTLVELLSVPGDADLYVKRFGELSEEARREGEALIGLGRQRASSDATTLAQVDPEDFNARCSVSLNHFVADRLAVRVRRVDAVTFTAHRQAVIALEEACYEPARQDDIETLQQIADHPEGVVCFAEDIEGLVGIALGSPLEEWAQITGPDEDPHRGLEDTLYSADISIDPRARGLGVGHRLRGALIQEALKATRADGAPRFAFVTGRNRVGDADVMWSINQRWGAYVTRTYDHQYGEADAQARYYRIPLRRADRRAFKPAQASQDPVQLWGVHNPTGHAHPLLERGRDLGVFDEGSLTKMTVSNFITPPYARYSEALRYIAPRGTAHMYFTSCPDEMIDKSIRSLKHNRPESQVVISFQGARFGGNTAAGRSLGECDPHFGWPMITHPSVDLARSLQELSEAVERAGGPQGVIAVMIEAVQPHSGQVLTDEAWRALCAWRDETGVPLVLSEVNTGFGRSGRGFWWLDGAQGDADLVLWWAGGQVGHIFARPQVFVSKPLTLISTWDGEDLSATRLLWQLYATDGGAPRPELEAWLDETLSAQFGGAQVGGLGLFRSVRHVASEALWSGLKARGIQVQRLGDAVIFAPPLTLSEVEQASFKTALSEVVAHLS